MVVVEQAATSSRILDAAVEAFGTRGYEATSLDDIARTLEIRKQTILYWFPSKETLMVACLDAAAAEVSEQLSHALGTRGGGWPEVERVMRKAFRLAARRPALVGLLREADRLGGFSSALLATRLEPLVQRAIGWLRHEMEAGRLRQQDPEAVVLSMYSMLTGLATELDTQQRLGMATDLRSIVRRARSVELLLRDALAPR